MPDELDAVLQMRAKGRTFSYIEKEMAVCHEVIRRELLARGVSTAPVKPERRVRRSGGGFWRSFDPA